MKLLVINGPNLNLLGWREPELYGREDYATLVRRIEDCCAAWNCEVEVVQSNHEGELVDAIQQARGRVDGIVINAAAYSHTSIALLDALKAVGLPAMEVHLTDIHSRESFRHHSYTAMACLKTYAGLGIRGYELAIEDLLLYLGRLAPAGRRAPETP